MADFFRHAWDILLRFLGALGGLLGGGSLQILCILMGVDYGTGLLLGLIGKSKKTADGRLSARACFMGLMRKGMMILIILASALLDMISGQGDLLRRAATGFYICNECISLMENAALLGVPVPGSIRRALSALGEKEKSGDGNVWKLPSDAQ
ncbi:MAG: phage holin family protein [Clostridiales bacterium]|nr:phage holin family protein [Clostridiales bacterium]